MNIWHDIKDDRITPDEFIAVIEISKGAKKKYELDKETGLIILDRVLHTSMDYPANYGFIPRTLAEDGDALDVLVLCSESLDPLTLVKCYPIGIVNMIDSGKQDKKVIAIPFGDALYNEYKTIKGLPKHVMDELVHFLSVYKDLDQGKYTEVDSLSGVEEAKKEIATCKKRYAEKFGKNGK